jgi:exosortase/archaeosortase family protein
MQAIGVFLIQMLVFWPVWQWYFAKLGDPAEDEAVLVALGTAMVFLVWKKSAQKCSQIPLRIPILLLLLYTITFPLFSPLPRAIIAVFTLSYTLNYWRFGDRFQPWLYGLLLLSLPVLSPMQFYLSYPVRIIVGRLATLLLQMFGFPVVFEGIAFKWGGEYIWLDELCSGIRKLWAGLFFTFALAAFYDLRAKKTVAITGFAVLAFIMANVLRTAFLFYVKADLFAEPWWLHKSGGILMFLLAAIATVCFAQWLKKRIAHETHELLEKEEL